MIMVATLLHSIDLLKTPLLETPINNLLVQSCKISIESKVFLTELSVLSYFTLRVTLPLLDCDLFGCKEYFIEQLPLLWKAVKKGDLGRLKDCEIKDKHVSVSLPSLDATF